MPLKRFCWLCCKRGWADLVGYIVTSRRPALFRGRHFEDVIILLCVRWYLRYSLTYRDLEEIMAERNLCVEHVTIWRWVQRYAPILNQRIRRELRRPNRSWRVDETYVKVSRQLGLPVSRCRFCRRDDRVWSGNVISIFWGLVRPIRTGFSWGFQL